MQEFRVTVAGQGADEGRSSGGQVVLVTKSGTNQLHGSAYEYNRNTIPRPTVGSTIATASASPLSIATSSARRSAAPSRRTAIFYFFNYERRIDASSQAVERMVPTENLKQGILTFADTNE